MNDRGKFDQPDLESLMPAVPFSRRGFLVSSAASGFALAAGPLIAQQAIKTPADRLDVGEVKVPVPGGEMPAYWAAPKKPGKFATIIVIPEIWGLHEYQRDIVRRLARAGYFAVSADPYFRSGDLSKVADLKQVVAAANSLTDQQAFADLDALVAWVGKQPKANVNKLGITGMCRGGRTVWMYTAHNPKIKAGVAWYGNLSPAPPGITTTPLDITDRLNAPILGLYAGADGGIPMPQIERLRAGLLAFGKDKDSIIIVYPDMPHGFHADYRNTYRKEAAEDGWKRMLAWFKKHGLA
ncbi:MAG TPA: dienelactone hydrolase family protein [Burkholderiales bacterium]|nr:dienelactone hydrolase family protein [Burkholderiales bacterium]